MSILSNVEKKINCEIPSYIKNRIIEEFSTNRNKIEEVINRCVNKR